MSVWCMGMQCKFFGSVGTALNNFYELTLTGDESGGSNGGGGDGNTVVDNGREAFLPV